MAINLNNVNFTGTAGRSLRFHWAATVALDETGQDPFRRTPQGD